MSNNIWLARFETTNVGRFKYQDGEVILSQEPNVVKFHFYQFDYFNEVEEQQIQEIDTLWITNGIVILNFAKLLNLSFIHRICPCVRISKNRLFHVVV